MTIKLDMNSDYKNGYRDGFKDGFEQGRKSVPLEPVKSNPPLYDPLKGIHMPPSVPEWPRNMANTANSTLSTDFNVTPYYDDYDETKGYYRILYKPGFAVEADICPKCGIRLDRVMGYVCHSVNCPTFPQATSISGEPYR